MGTRTRFILHEVDTAWHRLVDAEIHHRDCGVDRQQHLATHFGDVDFVWWLADLLGHDERVQAAERLLERRRREFAALKVAA